MGILTRFADIIKADVNALIDKCEDPAKMIDQTLRDLAEGLRDVKEETAAIMAEESRARRKVEELTEDIQEYAEAAKRALLAGNEGDATKLLERKQTLEQQLATANNTYAVAQANASKMRQMYDKLVNDINILNSKRENIKAQVAMAKAQERINGMTSAVNAQSSIDKFSRMEAKAQNMLDKATAEAQLNLDAANSDASDIKAKYSSGAPSAVSDELEKMKRELGLIPETPETPETPADPVEAYLQGTQGTQDTQGE